MHIEKRIKGQNKATGGFTDKNHDFIFNALKYWRERAKRAETINTLYKRCKEKAGTPESFYYEEQLEQILNKK